MKQYPLAQGCSPLQGCSQGVWAQQRVPGGGSVEERPGAAGQTARGGGGQQQSAQRTQSFPLRGPGLRPAGERQTRFISFKSSILLVSGSWSPECFKGLGLVLDSDTFCLVLVLVCTGRTGQFWSRLVETQWLVINIVMNTSCCSFILNSSKYLENQQHFGKLLKDTLQK